MAHESIALHGRSLIAGKVSGTPGQQFHGRHPGDGRVLEPVFYSASGQDVDAAVEAAQAAAPKYAKLSGKDRAAFLRRIADGIDAAAPQIVGCAHLETALPLPRLTGETARTTSQLRLFASLLEEGSWVSARIDTADPARNPPKPDVRSMLRPLGPVAVFGASNFPLAFSVAGGDTASALAAGNPVVFKAHPAHPATSELVGHIINNAVRESGLAAGVFSLLFDHCHAVGTALVQHEVIRAVAFTGSFRGGRALMDLAAKRKTPIPVYAEMGSTNPVFVLPGALKERASELAKGLQASYTLGGGQFCTKPGLVFAEAQLADGFTAELRNATIGAPAFPLLTEGIATAYRNVQAHRDALHTAAGAAAGEGYSAQTLLMETTGDAFLADASLAEEIFGPTTLLVHCSSKQQMMLAAQTLEGHLTATILGTEDDLREHAELVDLLEAKVGRLIFNAFPTGVEVCHAMVHGGPYPATSDGRSTSVGTQAIFRFTRPVCYQGLPQSALPNELKDSNPLGILRLWNGEWSGLTPR